MERVSYKECLRNRGNFDCNRDGCQGFLKRLDDDDSYCLVCGCHQNYHRKDIEATSVNNVTQAVYTKCLKIHNYELLNSVDGCQEFMPLAEDALTCAGCGCHRSFHRKEITAKKI